MCAVILDWDAVLTCVGLVLVGGVEEEEEKLVGKKFSPLCGGKLGPKERNGEGFWGKTTSGEQSLEVVVGLAAWGVSHSRQSRPLSLRASHYLAASLSKFTNASRAESWPKSSSIFSYPSAMSKQYAQTIALTSHSQRTCNAIGHNAQPQNAQP